jgi:hypothetical protein
MRELIEHPELRLYLMDSDFEEDPWGAAAFELACGHHHRLIAGDEE